MKQQVFETRVDICRLAECALAFETQQLSIRSKSALIASCVDGLAEVLKSNGAVPHITDVEAAQEIVDRVLKPRVFNAGALRIGSIQQKVQDALNNLNPNEGD